jgi:hypothetical protein
VTRRDSELQAPEPIDGLDDETFERVADRERDNRAAHGYEPGTGEDEHGNARGASQAAHEPAVGLDDPRVSAVPETTPQPGESDAHAAARLNRRGDGDAWGEPEDQPDHDGNEAYVQQDEGRP